MIKTFLRFLRLCGLLIIDSIVMLYSSPSNRNRILVIRIDAIGDFILWLDAAKNIRKLYPKGQYEVVLLGNEIWTSLAEDLPYFDRVCSLNVQRFITNPAYRYKMLRELRKAGFGVVIQPTFSRVFLTGDAIAHVSGAAEKIAYHGDYSNIKPWQKRISDRWYTRIITSDNRPLMELERNAEFMRKLGLKDFCADVPELPVSAPLPKSMRDTDYYVLAPGSGLDMKRWPTSNFVKLAQNVYHATGWMGVICGSPGEKILGKMLAEDAGIPMQDWTGHTSLRELIAIIDGAHLLIGNDTGAVHIAAAVSTPAVCILGGGHYGRFMPYQLEGDTAKPLPVAVTHKMACFGCNWRCIYGVPPGEPVPCIKRVSVEAVWKEVLGILEKGAFNDRQKTF